MEPVKVACVHLTSESKGTLDNITNTLDFVLFMNYKVIFLGSVKTMLFTRLWELQTQIRLWLGTQEQEGEVPVSQKK